MVYLYNKYKIEFYVTGQGIALTIFQEINFAYQNFGREILARAGLDTSLADLPIEVRSLLTYYNIVNSETYYCI